MESSANNTKKTIKKKVITNSDKDVINTEDSNLRKKYVKLDQITHVKTRPGMYIGSIEEDVQNLWILNNDQTRMEKKIIKYIPGLFKIFDEIIVNAIDHVTRLKTKDKSEVGHYVKNINVSIDKETGIIEVINDGDGIEVVIHPEHKIYIPELIFANMLTSTNYDDNEEKIVGGTNGLGAKLTCIFSEFFEIETVDSKRKLLYKQKYDEGMTKISEPIIEKSNNKPYTKIRFKPDYKSFKIDGLNESIYKLFEKRVYDICALTDREINVVLNGKKIEINNFEKYIDLYIGSKEEHTRVYEYVNENWEICASYNDFNGFEQISFVNGIWTIKGGKHVDYILNQIVKKLIEVIQKKKKNTENIRPQTVKDNMILFVKCNIVNPSFDSQSKETLTTPITKFKFKADITDKFIDKLYKSGIVEKIMEINQIHNVNSLKKTDGKKKNVIRGIHKLDDANFAGTNKSSECTLILTEGDSAKTMALAGLSKVGRDRYGVFPLRGKLLNVKDVSMKKILENEEITNLKKILGLETGKIYKNINDLRYGKIMIMTDQDHDGSHIKGLLFNMFYTMWPSLIKDHNFMSCMMTPIVKVFKGNMVHSFYNLSDFEDWKKINNNYSNWTIKYYKGLGTSTEEEAIEYFTEMKTLNYFFDQDKSDESLDLAFNKKRADERKIWLSGYDRKNVLDYKNNEVSYTDFINKELIHFSNYDIERSIPSICDGLKISQRKILYGCFKKNLVDKEMRVAQLASYVSEHTMYHHGETSLQGAIIGMAQDFVGANNINLLTPNGQFGTRVMQGKDASQPRYIYTLLNTITTKIFIKQDQAILKYLEDDGFQVEPEFYIPIIPMILVNGAIGIGTGFSTNIPNYNPKDIIRILKNLLNDENVDEKTELAPWYIGYTGDIIKQGDKYVSKGKFNKVSISKIQITELPIGMGTDDFKSMLEDLLDDNKKDEKTKESPIKHYDNNSSHIKIDFTLHFNNSTTLEEYMKLENNNNIKLENEFKLISSKNMGTTNMYLFNEKGQITKYENPIHIIKEFYRIRLEFYNKRKLYLLEQKKDIINLNENKIRFIKDVINNIIIVHKLTKLELENKLKELEYFKHNDSYDYLIKIPIYNLTMDKVEELENECSKYKGEYEDILNKNIKTMWLEDLISLEKEYEKYEIYRLNKLKNNKILKKK